MTFCLLILKKTSICNKPIAINIYFSLICYITCFYRTNEKGAPNLLQLHPNFNVKSNFTILDKNIATNASSKLAMTLQLLKPCKVPSFPQFFFIFLLLTCEFLLICLPLLKNFMPNYPFYISSLSVFELWNGINDLPFHIFLDIALIHPTIGGHRPQCLVTC
jgi:hypothetical protein